MAELPPLGMNSSIRLRLAKRLARLQRLLVTDLVDLVAWFRHVPFDFLVSVRSSCSTRPGNVAK